MAITGNKCVDEKCCVVNYVYTDPLGLLNHEMYLICVTDAAKECELNKSQIGKVVSAAAKSAVNK